LASVPGRLIGSGIVRVARVARVVNPSVNVSLAIPEPGSLALLAFVRRRTLGAFRSFTFG